MARSASQRGYGRSLAAIASLVVLASAAAVQAAPIITHGRERAILYLLLPFVDEGVVVPGVRLVSIQIEAAKVGLSLRGTGDAVGRLTLTPRDRGTPPSGPAFAIERAPCDDADLRAGLDALAAAIAANDDGSFVFATSAAETEVAASQSPQPALAALLWCVLLAALAAALLGFLHSAARQWQHIAGGARVRLTARPAFALATFGVALMVRLALPFAPLHANDHAWEDAAVALEVAGEERAEARQAQIYGPAYKQAQRALVAIVGRDFDGLAVAGAIVGSLAAMLAALAALAVGGPGFGLLAALVMIGTPLAARIAASESDLVVAQALVAVALWAAVRAPTRVGGVVIGSAVALLALGHIVGPAYAAGAAGLAVALRHAARLRDPQLAVGDMPLLGRRDWALATREALGLALVAGCAGAIAGVLRIAEAWPLVASRNASDAGGAGGEIGSAGIAIASDVMMLLARDSAWFPVGVLVAATFVMIADLGWRQRLAGLGPALLGSAALWSGAIAMTAGAMLIIASVTDALRYQSVMVPALVVVCAGLPAAAGWLLGRWPALAVTFGVVVAGALIVDVAVHDIAGTRAGMTFADSQIAGWTQLKGAMAGALRQGEAATFIVARGTTEGAALPDAPRGRWSGSGPTSAIIAESNARAACAGGLPFDGPTFVWLPPACDATQTGPGPCANLLPFREGDRAVASGRVEVAQQWNRQRPPGEFLAFADGTARWSLWRARCPTAAPAP